MYIFRKENVAYEDFDPSESYPELLGTFGAVYEEWEDDEDGECTFRAWSSKDVTIGGEIVLPPKPAPKSIPEMIFSKPRVVYSQTRAVREDIQASWSVSL